jgi:hypothetical protein
MIFSSDNVRRRVLLDQRYGVGVAQEEKTGTFNRGAWFCMCHLIVVVSNPPQDQKCSHVLRIWDNSEQLE